MWALDVVRRVGRVNFELVNPEEAEKELESLSFTGTPPAAAPAGDKDKGGEKPAVPGA